MSAGETYAETVLVRGRVLGWASRLFHRVAPWLAGGSATLISLAGIQRFDDWTHPAVLGMATLIAVAAGLARRWRWPLFATATVALVVFTFWAPSFLASYYAGTSLRRRLHLALYAVIATVVLVVASRLPVPVPFDGPDRAEEAGNVIFMVLLTIGLGMVAGLWIRARREVVAGLHERAERLEREQAARTEQAREQERARIAREMHDVVAHRVSLMVLHAGALEVSAPDERTAEAAGLIRSTGREALANLRDVLGVLRSPHAVADSALSPPPVLVDLERLLGQSRAAGIPIEREDEGSPRRLPVIVEQTAYRVVQEALTNVHKHAGDSPTEVAVRYLPGMLEVMVRNHAPGRPVEAPPASGFGLVGLRERVELLGGELDAGPQPDGGFLVLARLPADTVEEPA
ncbi:sensor histidine kinase [Flindersiella endophytica]